MWGVVIVQLNLTSKETFIQHYSSLFLFHLNLTQSKYYEAVLIKSRIYIIYRTES